MLDTHCLTRIKLKAFSLQSLQVHRYCVEAWKQTKTSSKAF